ncbi:P-loop containing nucleoside triphosphate hydrolase protein [Fistulina hepatica ATCC 64428]|uniref:p-loop containing nucleoside triphosphate hydrolase protein n=1 Tax=Fistulina hepatica ATCC 64428 TaxID=1128425 RepID=A0A0D7AAZ6_9AGAR|nr:P-loop containing nucleoside triphosphate hydrolase protein [Fistulina hepatica ATCC 64428]
MRTGAFSFSWKNVTFTVYKAVWEHGWCVSYFYNLVFDAPDGTDAVGRELAEVVYRYSYALKKEMWVFEDASWAKSTQLWHSIQAASWDEVVLEDAFTADLRRDTETFFASREIYASLGIAWKRGILFLGPPGNGKTQVISALLKDLPYQALYVKSFTTKKGPESGIRRIFSHARNCAPCILVLEDLDAMIKPQSRSFFLNEMDGLAENSGVLTIATTNHPERIDDAILNRPSRFDVKYTFALPTPALRARYTGKWLGKVRALIQASDMWRGESLAFGDEEKLLAAVVDKTEGWSFAFLKELYVTLSVIPVRARHLQSLILVSSHSYFAWRTIAQRAQRPQMETRCSSSRSISSRRKL